MIFIFIYKSKKKINDVYVYTDASVKEDNNACIAFTIYSDKKGQKILYESSKHIGKADNSIAEFTAILEALGSALEYTRGNVWIYSDSKTSIEQINGDSRISSNPLKSLCQDVKSRELLFDSVNFIHVRRAHSKIKRVDKLAKLASKYIVY